MKHDSKYQFEQIHLHISIPMVYWARVFRRWRYPKNYNIIHHQQQYNNKTITFSSKHAVTVKITILSQDVYICVAGVISSLFYLVLLNVGNVDKITTTTTTKATNTNEGKNITLHRLIVMWFVNWFRSNTVRLNSSVLFVTAFNGYHDQNWMSWHCLVLVWWHY